MNINFKYLLITFISLTSVLIDLITKFYIKRFFISHDDFVLKISKFLNFVCIYNNGTGLGIFADQSLFLVLFISICALILVSILIYKTNSLFEIIGLSMILGGGCANIVDRLINGSVFDFIDINIMNFHFFTFNFADITITIGCIIYLTLPYLKKAIK